MANRILITGGAGFIGLRTAIRLAELGHEVVILDNFLPQIHGTDGAKNFSLRKLDKKITVMKGDVLNADSWKAGLEGAHAVLHLAALTGTGQSMYENYNYCNVNVGGTAILMDLLPQYRETLKKVVIASSRSIYGEGKFRSKKTGAFYYPATRDLAAMKKGAYEFHDPQGGDLEPVPTDEESPINPLSTYAITKYGQEKMILNSCAALGVDAIALRYQNVFGPGQSLRNPYTGIVSIFSTAIIQGRKINVFEDGLASRDFVYIDDVVDANVKALAVVNPPARVINVGTGYPATILDVVNALSKHIGRKAEYFISGEFRFGDIRHNFADIGRLKSILGFVPSISFDEGIRRFVEWARASQDDISGVKSYEASLEEIRAKGLMGKKQ